MALGLVGALGYLLCSTSRNDDISVRSITARAQVVTKTIISTAMLIGAQMASDNEVEVIRPAASAPQITMKGKNEEQSQPVQLEKSCRQKQEGLQQEKHSEEECADDAQEQEDEGKGGAGVQAKGTGRKEEPHSNATDNRTTIPSRTHLPLATRNNNLTCEATNENVEKETKKRKSKNEMDGDSDNNEDIHVAPSNEHRDLQVKSMGVAAEEEGDDVVYWSEKKIDEKKDDNIAKIVLLEAKKRRRRM